MPPTRRRFLGFASALAIVPVGGVFADDPAGPKPGLFAMDTAFGDLPPSEVKALGYDGVSLDFARDWPLDELDRLKLPLAAVYGGIAIDIGRGREAVERAIRRLAGRSTIVWITLASEAHARSSPDGDASAVALLRPLADLAKEHGLSLAIYPHAGFWAETIGDALRVANRVDRPNMGVTFNLCHFLRCEKAGDLRARLESARSRLLVVTLNGADPDGKDWDRLIQPLDRGSFDNRKVLAILREIGYRGPIGLQGYGVPGDKRENLRRSIAAWEAIADGR